MSEPVILIQGGAKSYEKVQRLKSHKEFMDGVKHAALTGYKILKAGGCAVEAVEVAVSVLENSVYFNAGRGSNLTAKDSIEMDAAIMDGSDLRVGGVTCVTNLKNPVKLARAVMEKSNAILLTGEGAKCFAEEHLHKSAFAPQEYFVTSQAKSRLAEHLKEKNECNTPDVDLTSVQSSDEKDTVGAIALDTNGNVAFANSTGGLVGKASGRIGDSPIVGGGGYADNTIGAISATGDGEQISKVSLAKHISILLEQGNSAQTASEEAVNYMKRKVGGSAGVVTITPLGDIGIFFNSRGMAWALGKKNILSWGMLKGEENSQALI